MVLDGNVFPIATSALILPKSTPLFSKPPIVGTGCDK